MVFGFDMFEPRLAHICFLGIDHWLAVFMEFKGSFCENLGPVQKLLHECSLHSRMGSPDGFGFSREQRDVCGLPTTQEEKPSSSGTKYLFVIGMCGVDTAEEYEFHAIVDSGIFIICYVPVVCSVYVT